MNNCTFIAAGPCNVDLVFVITLGFGLVVHCEIERGVILYKITGRDTCGCIGYRRVMDRRQWKTIEHSWIPRDEHTMYNILLYSACFYVVGSSIITMHFYLRLRAGLLTYSSHIASAMRSLRSVALVRSSRETAA